LCGLNNIEPITSRQIQRVIAHQPTCASHSGSGPLHLLGHMQEQHYHVVNTRRVGSRIGLYPFNPFAGSWINHGAKHLEGHIDPGKLLLSLHLKSDQAWGSIDDCLNTLFPSHCIKKRIVDHAHIVVGEACSGSRSHDECGSSEGASMVELRHSS